MKRRCKSMEELKAQKMILGRHYWISSENHIKLFPKEKYYTKERDFVFHWKHGKTITIPAFMYSDGATCAKDLIPLAWFVHDRICVYPYFDDGSPISNLKASWIYRSILSWNGKGVRARIRLLATFLFGGGKVKRLNGWLVAWKGR